MSSLPSALICVTGPIGAGKSTLVELLAARLEVTAYRERNDTNPAYAAALMEPKRWAFESEMTFLVECLTSWVRARVAGEAAVLERCAADNAEVFAGSRLAHGEISDREFRVLSRCAALAQSLGGIPDLVVLLSCSAATRLERVRERNEEGEFNYTEAYLEENGERYEEWGRAWSASPLISFDSGIHDVRAPVVLDALVTDVRHHLEQRTAASGEVGT